MKKTRTIVLCLLYIASLILMVVTMKSNPPIGVTSQARIETPLSVLAIFAAMVIAILIVTFSIKEKHSKIKASHEFKE